MAEATEATKSWISPAVLIGAIIAVILGKQARDEIDQSGGAQTGRALATVGWVIGWVYLGLMAVLLVIVLVIAAITFVT